MTFEPGRTIGGKYRLETEFARGGMGAIWRATHNELDMPVAVKIVTPELGLSPIALSRFKQEARAAAQLRSPNVVQIIDYGVEDGAPFMVMELLAGNDLAAEIERSGRIAPSRVVAISAGITRALRLAHDAQIVHRDLKPENVFLAKVGDEEVVKVLDFGIAKALTGDMTLVRTGSSTLIGSPLYMSPEQSRAEPVDVRTDLWSLGVVLFEALTGEPPFQGRGLGDVFAAVCMGETPVPSHKGIFIPGLDEFFKRALAKEREDRFASAKDLHEALSRCIMDAEARGIVSIVDPVRTVAASSGQLGSSPPRGLISTQAAISSEIKGAPKRTKRRGWAALVLAATALGGGLGFAVWMGTTGPSGSTAPQVSGDDTAKGVPAAATGSTPNVQPASEQPPAVVSAGGNASADVAESAVVVDTAAASASAIAKASSWKAPPGATVVTKTAAPVTPTATVKRTAKPDDTFGVQ